MKVKCVNFSNKYATGSVDARRKTVEQICSNVYSVIISEYKKPIKFSEGLLMERSNLPFNRIEKLLKNILPEPLNFYIAKEKKSENYDGCIKPILDNHSLINYRMELPLVDKNLHVTKLPTFMHELTHLLDFATNPQYRILIEKLSRANMLENTGKFYKETYYNHSDKSCDYKKIIQKTQNYLKTYTTEEKLLILKYIELQIKTEINGFNANKEYGRKVNSMYYTLERDDFDKYKFDEKLYIVGNLRSEIIKKERLKIKKNLRFKFLDRLRRLKSQKASI